MTPFLESIARQYISRYGDLSRFCFLFPNKRGGTFFLKYLRENAKGVMLAPEVIGIGDMMERLSGRTADSRLDLLFTLFDAYRDLQPADKRKDVDFESFRSWGDVVLSDFSEVDMYGVDPHELFTNLSDLRKIKTEYLTDDQRRIMKEYFGVEEPEGYGERFWSSMAYNSPKEEEQKRKTGIRTRFLQLWESLSPLYDALQSRLADKPLGYPGMIYKEALERIIDDGTAAFGCDKLVMCGFNVLSGMELSIFTELKKLTTVIDGTEEPFADFLWDAPGEILRDPDNSASRFLLKNIKVFPKPEWVDLTDCEPEDLPEVMEVTSSPSNAAQAKIASSILTDLRQRIGSKEFDSAKAAVVLPDENLLLPLLYSLPPSIDSVNLTMGYSLKLTPVISFVTRLRLMQLHKSLRNDVWCWYHQDVRTLLSHPYATVLCGRKAIGEIIRMLDNNRLYAVPAQRIAAIAPVLGSLFVPLTSESTQEETLLYLNRVLTDLKQRLSAKGEKDNFDADLIDIYLDALHRLGDALRAHDISVSYYTIFSLADRLLASEKINFEGEPLKGLQIMGLLETRGIDFDYLIIPSMNERIFPRRLRIKSFIPNNLRMAYGMAPAGYQEAVFAYYFYRMTARCKEVHFIYDASASGLKSADQSRYLLQLRNLYARDRLSIHDARFTLVARHDEEQMVLKTPTVMQQLAPFHIEGSESNLSASALTHYNRCPLLFYFESVMKVTDPTEPSQFMDPITLGIIVHDVMLNLYIPDKEKQRILLDPPVILTERHLKDLLDNPTKIDDTVRHYVNKNYLKLSDEDAGRPLKGDASICARMIGKMVRKVIRKDMRQAPVTLLGCEVSGSRIYTTSSGTKVNIKYAIDRIDRVGGRTRIVDYKTGSVHIVAANGMADVFSPSPEGSGILQLLLYANLYNLRYYGDDPSAHEPLQTVTYNIVNMELPNSVYRSDPSKRERELPSYKGSEITSHLDVNGEFLEHLDRQIEEIFDETIPFAQTTEKKHCAFCSFRSICGK